MAMRETPQTRVYFDHNATTPLDPRIAEAMAEWLRRGGNPSSLHATGRAARETLEAARERVAVFLGAGHPSEVVFAASGTELNNAVMSGVLEDHRSSGPVRRHVVVSALEHPSVLAAAERLRGSGVEVSTVDPRSDGRVSPEDVAQALREETSLVALMLANNELGTVQPVRATAERCREAGVPVLCDAVQAAGKIPFDAETLGVDHLVIAAHKFNGPIGAAALWTRPGVSFRPLLVGGTQERRRRAGTENVPAIAGLGLACELARRELDVRSRRMAELRDRFEAGLAEIEGARVHCASAPRLPNTSSVRFDGLRAQDLLVRLDLAGFEVSTGSACSSGSVRPSALLLALGLGEEEALSTLRVSFGPSNTADQVDGFLEVLGREISRLRSGGGLLFRGRAAVAAGAEP